MKNKESIQLEYKFISNNLKDNLEKYSDLIKGKYTDANVSLMVMETALNETNKEIISNIKKLKKLERKFNKL